MESVAVDVIVILLTGPILLCI